MLSPGLTGASSEVLSFPDTLAFGERGDSYKVGGCMEESTSGRYIQGRMRVSGADLRRQNHVLALPYGGTLTSNRPVKSQDLILEC